MAPDNQARPFLRNIARQLPGELSTMAKEKNTKQVNNKKESTKSLKEKRAAKQTKREEKSKKEY
jgi:hypothetical protein